MQTSDVNVNNTESDDANAIFLQSLYSLQNTLMHLSIETPTPPPPTTPGLCGAMWGIFMVFEGMVSPWGWGISQDLLSIFMEVHESRGARWGFDSCLVSSR